MSEVVGEIVYASLFVVRNLNDFSYNLHFVDSKGNSHEMKVSVPFNILVLSDNPDRAIVEYLYTYAMKYKDLTVTQWKDIEKVLGIAEFPFSMSYPDNVKVYTGVGTASVSTLARTLPAVNDFTTKCPVEDCTSHQTLYYLVQHVNDDHKWTRESIADWLDDLHDTGIVDLSFKVKDTEERLKP